MATNDINEIREDIKMLIESHARLNERMAMVLEDNEELKHDLELLSNDWQSTKALSKGVTVAIVTIASVVAWVINVIGFPEIRK